MSRELSEYDCLYSDNPVCPHCGDVFDLGKHDRAMDVSYEDGGQSEWKCDGCKKDFVSVTVVSYSYCTAVDEEHASDEDWGPQEPAEPELETCKE